MVSNLEDDKNLSRFLGYILRHHPESIGAEMDRFGWVAIEDIISARGCTVEDIVRVSKGGGKLRFHVSDDLKKVRAYQGHTVEVEHDYVELTPPPTLYHGTATDRFRSILEQGLLGMERKWVHLTTDFDEAYSVGKRYGNPMVLLINSGNMQDNKFFRAGNGVWLTRHVPPEFISIIEESSSYKLWRNEHEFSDLTVDNHED